MEKMTMSQIIESDISRLRSLWLAAQPDTWKVLSFADAETGGKRVFVNAETEVGLEAVAFIGVDGPGQTQAQDNARFIAAAQNAFPALLKELERLYSVIHVTKV